MSASCPFTGGNAAPEPRSDRAGLAAASERAALHPDHGSIRPDPPIRTEDLSWGPRGAGTALEPESELNLADFPRDPIGTLRRLHARYGDAALLHSEQRQALFVFSPELNREVLTRPDTFHSLAVLYPGPRRSSQRRLAMSLVAANGHDYKQRRRIMLEPMKKNFLVSYLDDVVELADRMLGDWRLGQVRDVYRDMHQFMLRVTSGILFGLDQPEGAFSAGQMLDEFLVTDSLVGRPGVARLDRDPATYDRLLEQGQQLETRIQQLIDHRRATGTGSDVLSRMLVANDAAGSAVDDAKLIGDVAFLFGAAHKTTASALSWTLFLLGQHPSIAGRLYEELEGTLQGDIPSSGQLDKLPLLDRVLRESLRMLPPVSFMARQCAEKTELAGHLLHPGTLVMLSQFITQRRPDLYREPDRFDPERWLHIERGPFEYLPFSSGARRCLGAEFSHMVLKTFLSMLLQRFRLESVAGSRIDRHVTLVLEPKRGMPMTVRSARDRYQAPAVRGDIHELVALPGAGNSAATHRAAA